MSKKKKLREALHILESLGMPRAQLNERSALCLLALVDLKPTAPWATCKEPLIGITTIMDWAQLHYGVARLLHRLAASAALLLTIAMVWRCMRPCPLQPAAQYAVLLLGLMLALSALGFFSADPRRALVGFLNIVGG